jgi:hypothetical protein
MSRRREGLVVGVLVALLAGGPAVWAQSARSSSVDGPQPQHRPGTRMGPEMRERGAYEREEGLRHLGDMMRHLAGKLRRLGEAAMEGKLPPSPAQAEVSSLLNRIGAMSQRTARIIEQGRMSRMAMMEMGDQMATMQEAIKRIQELAKLPSR